MQNFFSLLADGFDIPVLNWIQTHLRTAFGDAVMPAVTLLGDGGIFWILLALAFLFFPRYRKAGLSMGIAMLMGVLLCNLTLKPLLARPRPFDYLWEHFRIQIPLLIARPTDYAFPSGHTLASFGAATALLCTDKRFGIPALCLAGLIAFSRLYLYVHYPTDVLFSMAVGVGFGFLGNYLIQKGYAKIPRRS